MPQTRHVWPGRDRRQRPHGTGEQASYWLLYVVAFPAALLHFHAGNDGPALLCALAAAAAVACIAITHHRR
ncbi:hypothetical protein LP52_22540 [Streptomonospora alba]|uniref:Uncharacterized protein n=1 Tax=Streptomonospora alba TaxID=183763 RepID=A0A0C2JIS2_9ACTN|nr:hypothetical protein [Streptomonospora alba]KIH96817.1 hypothetical protein LP52_22540 [Streptomonospora alba]